MMRTRHKNKTPTPLKVTSLKVSAKESRITTTANAHHKTTNASQDYEFHTMEIKLKKILFICSIQYKDIIPFLLPVNCVEMVLSTNWLV